MGIPSAIAVNMDCGIRALDISRSFRQADNLNERDRIAIIPPPTTVLSWTFTLHAATTDWRPLPHTRREFLPLRPLYGGRDDPARWLCVLSQRLRDRGFRQLKTDVCLFAKHTRGTNRMLQGAIAVHVDDILYAGAPNFLKETDAISRTPREGTKEKMSLGSSIAFPGILIGRTSHNSIPISQTHYIDEMLKIYPAEYARADGETPNTEM